MPWPQGIDGDFADYRKDDMKYTLEPADTGWIVTNYAGKIRTFSKLWLALAYIQKQLGGNDA